MLELMGSVKQVTHSPWKKEGHNWSLNVFKRIFKCPQRGQFGYDFSSAESLSCVQLFVSPGNTPGYLVHHQLPELAQTHVHRVDDAIQLSHLILCCPFLLLPSIFPTAGVFLMS